MFKQQLDTCPRSEFIEQAKGQHDTKTHRFQGNLLPYPNKPTVQKYLRFHVHVQSYQLKALPFGLSTASMEITMVIKKVKLMAQNKGIMIHQYLDN